MNIDIYIFGIFLGVGLIAVIWYTISSLRGSRKRFEEFEKVCKSLELEPEPVRYKHNLYPVMPLVTLADMERDEFQELGDRSHRNIDI